METYELTNPQKSIWITEQFYKGSSINNICATSLINEEVDFPKLEEAISELLKNNDIFRIKFIMENGIPKQQVGEQVNSEVTYFDVKDYEELNNIRKDVVSVPFALFNSFLYNFYIFKMPNNHGAIMLNIHHLLADSWTIGFLSQQVMKIYGQLKSGLYVPEPPVYSYAQYIESEKEYMQSERYQKDKQYWEEKFSTIPEIANINTIKDEFSDPNSFAGARKQIELEDSLLNKIRDYCKNNSISMYNFFMAIFSIYISDVSNLSDFAIGTPILNRTNFKEKNTAGMFVSNQVLRINLENINTFSELVKNIAKDSLNMLRHQKYPYQKLLEHLREGNKYLPNLYNILISYQITSTQNKEKDTDFVSEWMFSGNCADNLDIQIFDFNESGKLTISYDYKTSVFTDSEIDNLHNRIIYIIKQVLSDEDIFLKNIEIVTPSEKEELIHTFNNTSLDYDENIPIIKYFEDQAQNRPKEIALVFKNEVMTYEVLNEKANSLAYLLRQNNVTNNTIVGILVNRSFEMIIAILAVLKSGGSYIPIAPDYPKNRIEYMLQNSNASVLLTESSLKDDVNFSNLVIELDNPEIYNNHKENLPNISAPNDLSYVIYTSGSTGQPKGVMLTQKNLTNFYHSMVKNIEYLNLKKAPKIISITTLSFDIFIFETLISLTCGLTLYVADYYEQKITAKLERLIQENKIEILQTTPSIMKFHLENLSDKRNFASLKYIMLAGEQLPKGLVDQIKKAIPGCTIYNGYGPSETTIFSATSNVTDLAKINIGKPISNTQIYVLNKFKKLLPKDFMGEMYISGDGVGLGYLYNKSLTDEKYILNPFENTGSMMYESGDLGIWRDPGVLECKGRIDHQVKINGLRIELGEIEERINLFTDDNLIKSAVIVKKRNDKDTLNAFISYPKEIDIASLKKYLLNYLPNYMIPSTFTIVDSMPFTANGKIDRKALENFEIDSSFLEADISSPRNETEKILLNIIKKKLNVDELGIDSNIFDYGADSLTIINIITELFKYNFNLKVFDMYTYPTVREMYDNLLQSNSAHDEFDYTKFKHQNDIVKNFGTSTNANKIDTKYNILLTGATGFFGCHLLAELLNDTDKIGKIYCTMRAKNNMKHRERLLQKINFYFGDKYNKQFEQFVEIVDADISKNYFGMKQDSYEQLQSTIDIVIHSAANVKHYGKYSTFEKVNVAGTQNVLDFCKDKHIKLHYISTMTVSGNYLLEQKNNITNFDENSFYIGQNFDENVYSKSKLIAESLIIDAISKGQIATIYRIGDLTGRYSDGMFQENINENAIYLRLKSILEIGYIPNTILDNDLEFSPVDCAANAVKTIIWSDNNQNRIFDIYNPNMLSTNDLLNFMRNSNYLITVLEKDEFAKLIEKLSTSEENQKKLVGIINDFTNDKDLVYNYLIKQNNDITCNYLKNLGFTWPKIDNSYLTKILNYMKQVGFIE